jgi:hypothetical protein
MQPTPIELAFQYPFLHFVQPESEHFSHASFHPLHGLQPQ